MSIRVLVVDDHPVFRDGLAALVGSADDLVVAGTAASGEDAIAQAADADVVLMDLNMPGMSGIEATAAIAALPEPPAVLVVTMVDDDDTVMAAMRVGARGYVLKGATGAEILAAVRTVATGGAVLGAGVATSLLSGEPRKSGTSPHEELTTREREILEHLALGQNNKQIARELDLSLKTVQNYVSRVLDKLQVTDRTQAALLAREGRVR